MSYKKPRHWLNYLHILDKKVMSGFMSNTLLIRNSILSSVYIVIVVDCKVHQGKDKRIT